MKKPKEYWIGPFENEVHSVGSPFYGGKSGREELAHTHVIEYSAYKKLEEKLNKAISIAEYGINYANYVIQPNSTLTPDLPALFYLTLSYDGDLKLIEELKQYQTTLKELK